jgi:hypothetical protein
MVERLQPSGESSPSSGSGPRGIGCCGKSRGASTVIGFVILFGIVVMMVTIWQVQIIPSQNAEVEYRHSQDVRTDLIELRDGILDAPSSGQPRRVSVSMGTDYPDRTLYVNPPPVYGTIETVNASGSPFTIRVENASATDAARPGVGQHWNGSDRVFPTATFAYVPHYNELSYDPTFVYEHTVIHDVSSDGDSMGEQSIVDGRDVSLVALDSNVDASTTETLDLTAIPHGTGVRSVEVHNGSSPVTIKVPTRRSQDAWNRSLRGELTTNGGHVLNVTVDEAALTDPWSLARIRLASGVRYNVQMAAVSLGEGSHSPQSPTEYLTPIKGDGATTTAGETTRLVVEARNQFDNPVANRTVRFDTDLGQLRAAGEESNTVTVQTGRRGRATVQLESSTTGTATVTATAPDESGVDPLSLTVNVGSSTGDSGGGIYGVQWLQDSYEVTVGESYTFTANTTEPISDVPVTFAVENQSVATINWTDDVINESGARVNVRIDQRPPGGNVSNIYVSTSAGGDRAQLLVGEPYLAVNITNTNSPVEDTETVVVDARIDNTGNRQGSQTVELVVDGSVEDSTTVSLAPGESTTVTLEWPTRWWDEGNHTVVVRSADDSDTTTVEVANTTPGFELAAVLVAIVLAAAYRRYRRDGSGDED